MFVGPPIFLLCGVLSAVALNLSGKEHQQAYPSTPAGLSRARFAGWQYSWPTTTSTAPPPTTTTTQVAHGVPRRASRSKTNAEIEACIAARENGGSYGRSSNPTHFGKYQYDRQTWAAHGGSPADWGHASPEEQERVFRIGVNQYGYGAWRPYNGC